MSKAMRRPITRAASPRLTGAGGIETEHNPAATPGSTCKTAICKKVPHDHYLLTHKLISLIRQATPVEVFATLVEVLGNDPDTYVRWHRTHSSTVQDLIAGGKEWYYGKMP